jgi:hypothetical protein
MTLTTLTALIVGFVVLMRCLTLGASLVVANQHVAWLPLLGVALASLTTDGMCWLVQAIVAVAEPSLAVLVGLGLSLAARLVLIALGLGLSPGRTLLVTFQHLVLEVLLSLGLILGGFQLIGWLG